MAFKPIPVEGAVDASILNRIQANVASEFATLTNPDGTGITSISSSKSFTTYRAQSTDRYIVVNAAGGAMNVALPAPGNQQVITVVRSDSSNNAITITYQNAADAKKGSTSITLAGPTTLLNTGTTWVQI